MEKHQFQNLETQKLAPKHSYDRFMHSANNYIQAKPAYQVTDPAI